MKFPISNFQFPISRAFKFLLLTLLHIGAIGVILWAFWPVAKWYIDFRPLWGVDFFLLTPFVKLLDSHLVAPFAFWNYAGFSGWPAYIYPSISTYGVYFISQFFDLVLSVQIWAMASTALFLLGSYFLFFILSRSVVLAAILAIGAAYSSGVYQTLTWAGSIPSFAAQATFPWVLFFLVWYIRRSKMRLLLISALVAGIAIWGHPLIFVIYIVPAVFFLTFLRFDRGLAIIAKIKTVSIFLIVAIVIGLPLFATPLKNKSAAEAAFKVNYGKSALSTTTITPTAQTELERGIAEFNKAQVRRAFSDNHVLPFALLGVSSAVFLLAVVAVRRKGPILESLPYLAMAAYFAFYIWIFGQGVSIYHGGWYRLFWSVPVWVGALAAVLWGESFASLAQLIKTRILKWILFAESNLAILLIGAGILYAYGHLTVPVAITYRSQVSSAHPDVVNIKVSDRQREDLKSRLVPVWMDGDETNWRLYDADQTVNLWWSGLFKMPLARGYIDPPITDDKRGWLFLTDAALSETEGQPQLVAAFGYPHETAISNALFMIDWNAIRYFEGGHVGWSHTALPKYLEPLVGKRAEILEFNDARYTDRPVTLNYWEFKDELTSPILSATNASTLGIFASDGGFETVVRAIAERDNINSQRLIPIALGRHIDEWRLSEIAKLDALYLYDYDYKNAGRAFKLLTDYLASGKAVFIETGVEVKESEGTLPDFFPVKNVLRRGQGRQWQLENLSGLFADGVDFDKFSPPLFDEDEWKTSSADEADLRGGARVILENHGRVVLASQAVGSGEVIWSGLNLAYHLSRNHNSSEAKFFLNILASLVDISSKPQPAYKVDFANPNKRTIEVEGAKGVLFKEMAYGGWSARVVEGEGGNLPIYKAGPAYPGFMYVPLSSGKSKVEFVYSGSFFDKTMIVVSLLAVILIFEEVALGGVLIGRARRAGLGLFIRRVGRWWAKEEG